MTCRAGATKASWADRAGTAQPGLAGDGRQGRAFSLARHGQLHTVAAVSVFPFDRGEKLKIAVLSLYIFPDCLSNILLRTYFFPYNLL